MKLSTLLEHIEYEVVQGNPDTEVSALVMDSRKASPGSVYVAITGEVRDGHDFVPDVVMAGARAVIVEKDVEVPKSVTVIKTPDTRIALADMSAAYFGYPAESLKTIGITGTKGKTTASYMVRAILENAGFKTGLIGTIETIIGDRHIPSANTTPESYVVQEYFRKMVDAGLDCVVMEVSSQALKMHRVDGFTFDYGIFTNLSPDHIGPHEHDSLEDYIECKSRLFRKCRVGIFNKDSSYLPQILKGHTCQVETYGFAEDADIHASHVKLYSENGVLGVRYHMSGKVNMDVDIDIPGRFSVYNSMTAIAICRHFGVTESDISRALKGIRVKGRVEMLPVSPRFTVMIDYAHNAMALDSLLSTLREYHPKRLVCLFGCGGNRSKERRYEMGEVAAREADKVFVTSDNPRNEEPEDIIADILTGIRHGGDPAIHREVLPDEAIHAEIVTVPDRSRAIREAIETARDGDVIVLAGKGHEDYQEIRGTKYHMDEREIVADVVRDGSFIK